MSPQVSHHRVVIVGTGFAGLCAAIKLQQAGVDDFVILERSQEIGGTWRDNTYPGCCCDIRSNLYSFSFEQNPNWSRAYPPQAEIQDYLLAVCEKHGVRPHIHFETEVTEMRYDDEHQRWTISTAASDLYSADILLNATGPLSLPSIPKIPGLESFAGEVFHSATWRHDHDLTGERVAVIGTGASAIQFVPQIAPAAEKVTVFQRSAPWVVPREDGPVSTRRQAIYRAMPFVQRLVRWKLYLSYELLALGFLHKGSSKLSKRVSDGGREFIDATISDPALRDAVTPDYLPGCKRLLVSNDWYPALNRDDVQLVTDGIREIQPGSVMCADGSEHEVDTIIFGTGFAATDFLAPMKVFGADGIELSETWQDGAATHLGIAISGFPNFFMLTGPGTGLGHNSIVLMIEDQMRYIIGAVRYLNKNPGCVLNLKESTQKKSYEKHQERMKNTVWASGCNSWYLSADGRNDTLWPGYTFEYWFKTRRFNPKSYHLNSNVNMS